MALMRKLAVLTEIMISVAFSPESFMRAADLLFIWDFHSGLHRHSAFFSFFGSQFSHKFVF